MSEPIDSTVCLSSADPDVAAMASWLEESSVTPFSVASVAFGLEPYTYTEWLVAVLRNQSGGEMTPIWSREPEAMALLTKILDSQRICSERARFIHRLTGYGQPGKCRRTGRIIVRGPRYTQSVLYLASNGNPQKRHKYSATVAFRHSWQQPRRIQHD